MVCLMHKTKPSIAKLGMAAGLRFIIYEFGPKCLEPKWLRMMKHACSAWNLITLVNICSNKRTMWIFSVTRLENHVHVLLFLYKKNWRKAACLRNVMILSNQGPSLTENLSKTDHICLKKTTDVSRRPHMSEEDHICPKKTTYVWRRQNMSEEDHICLKKTTYIWRRPHMSEEDHICLKKTTYIWRRQHA